MRAAGLAIQLRVCNPALLLTCVQKTSSNTIALHDNHKQNPLRKKIKINNKVNIYISLPLQKTSKASSVDLTSTSVHPATYMLWFWSSRSILDWGGLKCEIQHEITSVATEWENKLFSHVAIKRSLCMGVYRQEKQKHKTGSQDKSWQHLKAKRQDTQNSYTKKISKRQKVHL